MGQCMSQPAAVKYQAGVNNALEQEVKRLQMLVAEMSAGMIPGGAGGAGGAGGLMSMATGMLGAAGLGNLMSGQQPTTVVAVTDGNMAQQQAVGMNPGTVPLHARNNDPAYVVPHSGTTTTSITTVPVPHSYAGALGGGSDGGAGRVSGPGITVVSNGPMTSSFPPAALAQPALHSEVLFFPDPALPCRSVLQGGECRRQNCEFAHTPTSLSRLLQLLASATRTLDICVFSITLDDIANAIIDAARRGVVVRIITDVEQMKNQGSDAARLSTTINGVSLRLDPHAGRAMANSYPPLMHNKFAVIDGHKVLTGSFNWTRAATLTNQENILITDQPAVVSAYQSRFEYIWSSYQPFSG